jgi:hypothetical protein
MIFRISTRNELRVGGIRLTGMKNLHAITETENEVKRNRGSGVGSMFVDGVGRLDLMTLDQETEERSSLFVFLSTKVWFQDSGRRNRTVPIRAGCCCSHQGGSRSRGNHNWRRNFERLTLDWEKF